MVVATHSALIIAELARGCRWSRNSSTMCRRWFASCSCEICPENFRYDEKEVSTCSLP